MKKVLILAISTSLVLFGCSKEEEVKVKKYYKVATVQTGNIVDNESFIGYVDSFNNVALASKVGGKIISITKNVGDRVRVGEVVAILDSTEAKTGYASSDEIIKSLENLKLSTSEMYDSQITIIQQKIKQAKDQVDIANIGISGSETGKKHTEDIVNKQIEVIENQIKAAQTGLNLAKLNLENTKNTLDQNEKNLYSNSKNAIENANILAASIIDFLDNLFGITSANKHKSESYKAYISAKNTVFKVEVEDTFNSLLPKLNELKSLPLNSNENIKFALERYIEVFSDDVRSLLKAAYLAMENSIESINFPQSIIESNKSKISSLQHQNEQVILNVSGNHFLGLKGSLDSINNFEKEKKSSLDLLEKQVELKKQELDTLLQTKEQITSAGNLQISDISTKAEVAKKTHDLSKNALNEAVASLELLKKQKETSLAEIESQIKQIKSQKNNAYVMIENGRVTSLIEGVVTKKIAEVGSIVGPGMPILMVSNDKNIKIEVQVPQRILEKISLGSEIEAEIEGVNELKKGTITKIFPTKDTVTKKTTVEITLNNKKGDIKIGSLSKVYFSANSRASGVIIPNSAIISKYNIPQVFILDGNTARLKTIEILKQNDNFSQVTGLNPGELIITDGKENIYDQEILD